MQLIRPMWTRIVRTSFLLVSGIFRPAYRMNDDLFILADNNRPYLMTHVEKSTDYINAIFVNVRISFELVGYLEQIDVFKNTFDQCKAIAWWNFIVFCLVLSTNPDVYRHSISIASHADWLLASCLRSQRLDCDALGIDLSRSSN